MRIALAQAAGTPGDVAANLADVHGFATAAARGGARLLVLPECFTTGYAIGADRLADLAEPPGGPVERRLATLSTDTGVAILCGLPRRDGAAVRNVALLVDGGETLAAAGKTHLYGDVDRSAFAAGERLPPVVELDGVSLGILICYDLEFPEPARALALAGAQLIAVPTALMAPGEMVAEVVVPARAVENQVFVAYANRVGDEGDLHYVGRSCVAGPDGVIARAGRDAEELLVADLDFAAIDRARQAYDYLGDRRPELYAGVTRSRRGGPAVRT